MRRLMTGPESLRPQANHFDLLRLVLAVSVIGSHSYLAVEGHTRNEPLHVWTGGRYTFGGVAVAGFIALSGFLVAESWHRSRSAWDFLRRRVARIYPAYLVCYAVSVAVAVTWAGGVFRGESAAAVAADLLLRAAVLSPGFPIDGAFADLPGHGLINVSLWTICVEFFLYFLLLGAGLLGLLAASASAWRVAAVAGLFAASVAFRWVVLPVGQYHDHGVSQLFVFPPSWTGLAPYFLAGMLAWVLRFHLPRSGWGMAGLLAAQVLTWNVPRVFDALLPVTLVYGLLYVGCWPGRLPRLPRWAGDLSYGSYLYGFLVQQVLLMVLPKAWWNVWVLTALAVPTTLAVALLSWHGLEKWFLPRARRTAAAGLSVEPADVEVGGPDGRTVQGGTGGGGVVEVSTAVSLPEASLRVRPSNVWVWAVRQGQADLGGGTSRGGRRADAPGRAAEGKGGKGAGRRSG